MKLLELLDFKYDYYYGRNTYYSKYILSESLDGLIKHSQLSPKASVKSKKIIQCGNLPFGISKKQIYQYNGRPNYVNYFTKDQITVLIYRRLEKGIKYSQTLFLINDALRFGQILLSPKSEVHTGYILHALAKKYLSLNEYQHHHDLCIKDADGNRIWTSKSFHFEINYQSAQLSLFQKNSPTISPHLRMV